MRQMGLPYAAEPAITLHLLAFLRYSWRIAEAAGRDLSQEKQGLLLPHRVLFNGGSMEPDQVRNRVLDVLAGWAGGEEPVCLNHHDLSLAVAVGAAYYGKVRRGEGVKVRGGISRSYFVEAGDTRGGRQYVCVMARDTDEHTRTEVPGDYQLQTNQKVAFNLYSSSTRLLDQPGDILADDEELTQVAPMRSVLKYGRGESEALSVRLVSELNEIGLLSLNLESLSSDHIWPLRFDLRAVSDADQAGSITDAVTVDQGRVDAAHAAVRDAFESGDELKGIVKALETHLDMPRQEWSLSVLRDLADLLLDLKDHRSRTPQHEIRWLNLLGFCLRPGLGDPADVLRMRQLWKLWFAGPAHPRQPQCAAEWWVLWRRVAPGLKSGHHVAIADSLEKLIIPKGRYLKHVREGDQAKHEMWRCLGSLEALPAKRKAKIGEVLMERAKKLDAFELWALARLGARQLFHAPVNHVIKPQVASRWIDAIVEARFSGPAERTKLFALSMLAALTDDRALDVSEKQRTRVQTMLEAHDAPAAWLQRLKTSAADQVTDAAQVLGDALPPGIVITAES